MTDIEVLLQQVANVLDMRNKVSKVSGDDFNIFSVLDMETDEVKTHTRLIYELLRPDGQHGMGKAFIEEFFRIVLRKPIPEYVSVKREYVINALGDDEYGRIDLLLEGRDFCFPIEVKIYAGDQNKQIERYTAFAKKAKNNQVFYLSLDGHDPTKESLGNINKTSVECLSFSSDIRDWLVRCGEIAWQTPAVVEIIRQYIRLLDKLTGNVEEDKYMKMIKNIIGSSRENFQSAVKVEQALKPLRIEMMQRIYGEIENHIGNLLNLYQPHRNYINLAKKYYNQKGSSWPSLSYLLTTCGDYNITLRFEVDYKLYYGVVFFKNEGDQVPKESPNIIDAFQTDSWRKMIKERGDKSKSWWLWFEYLPSNDKLINFREENENYLDLYDPAKHNEIMQEIFMEIDSQLESIKNTGMRC